MDTEITKSALRARLRTLRVGARAEKDARVQEAVFSLSDYILADVVYLYIALPNEPDTAPIISDALAKGKRVFAPVTGEEEIAFAAVTADTVFAARRYGVKEPEAPCENPPPPDIVLVPMVGYDLQRGRLGHGKGYYDKFLSRTPGKKVGLTYCDYQVESVCAEPHDVQMDIIITEKGILR